MDLEVGSVSVSKLSSEPLLVILRVLGDILLAPRYWYGHKTAILLLLITV